MVLASHDVYLIDTAKGVDLIKIHQYARPFPSFRGVFDKLYLHSEIQKKGVLSQVYR